MSPNPRPKFRLSDNDGERRLRTRLDILIALIVLQILLSIGIWVDQPRLKSAESTEQPAEIVAAEPSRVEPEAKPEVVPLNQQEAESSADDDALLPIDWSNVSIDVLNGCGKKGIAHKMQLWLKKNGFKVRLAENADRHDYTKSFIQDRSGMADAAFELAGVLNILPDQVKLLEGQPSPYVDLTLVIGQDYKRLPIAK